MLKLLSNVEDITIFVWFIPVQTDSVPRRLLTHSLIHLKSSEQIRVFGKFFFRITSTFLIFTAEWSLFNLHHVIRLVSKFIQSRGGTGGGPVPLMEDAEFCMLIKSKLCDICSDGVNMRSSKASQVIISNWTSVSSLLKSRSHLRRDYAPAALKLISLLCLSEAQSELIRDTINVWSIFRAADLHFLLTLANRLPVLRETISCCTLIRSGLRGCCIVSTNYLFSDWILSPLSACCTHTPLHREWWKLAASDTFRPPELHKPMCFASPVVPSSIWTHQTFLTQMSSPKTRQFRTEVPNEKIRPVWFYLSRSAFSFCAIKRLMRMFALGSHLWSANLF